MFGFSHHDQQLDFQRLVGGLTKTAKQGLVSAFDREGTLSDYRSDDNSPASVRQADSARKALVALMGLRCFEGTGTKSPVEIRRGLEAVLSDTAWVKGIADIGLSVWACSLVAAERVTDLMSRWDLRTALSDYRDARLGQTRSLSLLLTGLSQQAIAVPESLKATRECAFEAYRQIRLNQGSSGLFGHSSKNAGISGRFSGEIGTFEDQAHAIYAITKFSEAYGNYRSLEAALDCALALCERQGQLGQWWWRYNSSNGRVAERFPVFSVHQYGLGPMALLALGNAIHSDFTPWIHRGLQWTEDNELGADMRDELAENISKGIERTGFRKRWNALVNLATAREDRESRAGLSLLSQCGPQELGWSLYALTQLNGTEIANSSTGCRVYDPHARRTERQPIEHVE
jgi:hypothetical protein